MFKESVSPAIVKYTAYHKRPTTLVWKNLVEDLVLACHIFMLSLAQIAFSMFVYENLPSIGSQRLNGDKHTKKINLEYTMLPKTWFGGVKPD